MKEISLLLVVFLAGCFWDDNPYNDARYDKYRDEVEEYFEKVDANGDELITLDEQMPYWRDEERENFKYFDKNNDGFVDEYEYIGPVDRSDWQQNKNYEIEKENFDEIDKDRDGKFDVDDWLNKHEESLELKFARVDMNKDGVISKVEYVRWIEVHEF